MNRRAILAFVSGLPIAHRAGSVSNQLVPQRRFFLPGAPKEYVQHLVSAANTLYVLSYDPSTDLQSVHCTTTAGDVIQSFNLPQDARYLSLSVTRDGEFVLPRRVRAGGLEIEYRKADGTLHRSMADRAGAPAGKVYGGLSGRIVALRPDGSVEARALGDGEGWQRVLGSVGNFRFPRLLTDGSATAVFLDPTSAEGAVVNLDLGTYDAYTLDSEEIRVGKLKATEQRKEMPPSGKGPIGVPNLFAAATLGPNQRLYVLTLPCNPNVGLSVAAFDSKGRHIQSILFAYPTGKKYVPFQMTIIGQDIYMVFPDREVMVYSLGVS